MRDKLNLVVATVLLAIWFVGCFAFLVFVTAL